MIIFSSADLMQKARSKARIKLCNWMIVLSAIAFIGTAISGKKSVAQGDSVMKRGVGMLEEMKASQSKN